MIAQERDDAVEHADVNLLPASRALAREEGERDALSGQQPGNQVRDGDPDAIRRAVRVAGDAHQSAFGLDDGIVSRLLAPRPRLSES